MATPSRSIEALLTLDASNFHQGIINSTQALDRFKRSVSKFNSDATSIKTSLGALIEKLQELSPSITRLNSSLGNQTNFNKFANGVNSLAKAVQILGQDAGQSAVGVQRLNNIISSMAGLFGKQVIEVKGLASALRELNTLENQQSNTIRRNNTAENEQINTLRRLQNELNVVALGVEKFNSIKPSIPYFKPFREEFESAKMGLLDFAETGVKAFNEIDTGIDRTIAELKRLKTEIASTSITPRDSSNMLKLPNNFSNPLDSTHQTATEKNNAIIKSNTQAMRENGAEILRNMGYRGKLSIEDEKQSMTMEKNTQSAQKNINAMNRQATASRGLSRTLSSLRMMGTMVGSMLAYNFAHHLAQATNETIQSKSEMEGYFKMLNYGQDDIQRFNSALDQTVARFQRVNKYSLGETISSIGVEFNLTTDEMIKAMDVTSMITSEYLRAGRNANEASLAVKDVLQGQFQRLSRETGVKGEQLKEAGWNGDVNDVNSLLDALRKVAEDRNWDVFAEKANSLNDIVTILQNRFGEWSAEMVNVVQPSIVNAFNAIMSVGQTIAGVLGGVWQWLNTDGWGQTAVKIGLVGSALLSTSQMLVMYRAKVGLVEASQLGLSKSIASVIFGLKGQQVAEVGVRNSIMAKILGLKAEAIAEQGVTGAIAQKITSLQASSVQQEANSVATGVNTTAQQLSTTSTQGLAVAKEMETAQEEVNTAMKELNTVETLKQEGANTGLIASLYMLGTAELYDAEATGTLATAWGVLNGVFSLSPIGWLLLGLAGLATAVYALTGGFDSLWGSLQSANSAIEDASSATKPYRDYVEQTNQELEEAKEKYGENSLVVQALSEKYDRAKDSLDAYYEKLQQATSQHGKLNEALDTTSAKMDDIMRERLGDTHSSSELDSFSADVYNLELLQDHDYVALQKHEAMLGNYSDRLDEFADHAGNDTQAIKDFNKTYGEFISYSDKANTADNWWDWATNSFMAGLSGKSLEFQEWWQGLISDPFNSIFSENGAETINGINQWLTDIGNSITNFDLGGFIDEHISQPISNFLNDPLGSLGIDTSGFGDFLSSIPDPVSAIGEWISNGLANFDETVIQPAIQGITDAWNNFISFNWLNLGDGDGTGGGITKKIDIGALIKNLFNLGDGVDFSWATDFINDKIIIPLQTSWSEFMTDPMAFLGEIGETFGINSLIDGLLGVTDNVDISWAWEWVNTNIISPISQTLLMFLVDPVSFIGDMGFSINGLLDSIFGTDVFTSIWTWTYDSIITPIGNALWSGIQQIPLVGDIMLLLGFLSDENIGASEKGRAIANWIGNGITYAIGQIPIIGDIARMLGLIPQEEPNAQGKGKGIGDSIKDGVMNGLSNLGNQVIQEFNDILNGIGQLGEQAYNTAKGWADQLWQGVNSVLQRASPGFFHDQFQLEFGQDIPNAITEAGSTAYTVAQQYGQSIKDGISETSFNTTGFDSAVGIYENDAQIVADSSQLMGVTTTTAFNDMSLAVNQTTNTMSGNVATTYTGMQQKQQSSLNTMKNQNLQAYNDMYLKSNQSLIQMRDSTSNVTHQMVNAWDHMKNQIIASANRLKNDSTSHFNQLSNTIGSFYRKIQNPSNWGAGAGTGGTFTRSARHPSQGRNIARMMTRTASHHGAGVSPYTTGGTGKTMTLRALKNMICPSGNCDIFDGYDLSQKVNVDEFLALIGGEHGFGWNDWSGKHYNYIKSTSDQWGMKSPVIQLAGGIPTNADYKVGDFENGTPNISFSAFQSMAESIFSVIPYKFYYDSNWKGSWLGALQAGACNCSDGADALIAFASACGFSGYKQHTTTKSGIGHFYAVINGKAMDTTHFQNSGSWTPLGGAGIPTRTANPSAGAYPQGNKTVNINVEITGTVYGVDDLDSKIQESVQEGLRAEFNDPYTVAI